MNTTIKQNFLDTLFIHNEWFLTKDNKTGDYKPYLSKKLALQYYASTYVDFDFSNKRLLYKGSEGGTYQLSERESEYYESLLLEIKEAEQFAEKIKNKIKLEADKNNRKTENNILYKNIVINIVAYPIHEYICFNCSFLDYLKFYKESFEKLKIESYENFI